MALTLATPSTCSLGGAAGTDVRLAEGATAWC